MILTWVCEKCGYANDNNFNECRKCKPSEMPSTRLIPQTYKPLQETMASLRKLVREAHTRENQYKEALNYYANENNYNDNGAAILELMTESVDCQELDIGKIARKALEQNATSS